MTDRNRRRVQRALEREYRRRNSSPWLDEAKFTRREVMRVALCGVAVGFVIGLVFGFVAGELAVLASIEVRP